ncbi:MAG: LamG domain-containing protein [Flavobacteriaceae bacterium]|nr:LamG domain-containing protein [Flavobacteriaceae bacterium]
MAGDFDEMRRLIQDNLSVQRIILSHSYNNADLVDSINGYNGSNPNAIVYNPSGIVGGSATFNGTSSYYQIDPTAMPKVQQLFNTTGVNAVDEVPATISLMYRPNSLGEFTPFYNGATTLTLAYTSYNTTLRFYGASGKNIAYNMGALIIGEKYHITLTFSGVANGTSVRMYINGNYVATSSGSNFPSALLTGVITIGARSILDRNLRGDLDELKFWNVCLTDAEVLDLATKELAGISVTS